MTNYYPDASLVFDVDEFWIPGVDWQKTLLDQIRVRYDEIVESYQLNEGEHITHGWQTQVFENRLALIPDPGGDYVSDTTIIPSLLIYLNIFVELRDISEIKVQTAYQYAGLYGILTVNGTFERVTLTNIHLDSSPSQAVFTLDDLDDRDFMISGEVPNDRWKCDE